MRLSEVLGLRATRISKVPIPFHCFSFIIFFSSRSGHFQALIEQRDRGGVVVFECQILLTVWLV